MQKVFARTLCFLMLLPADFLEKPINLFLSRETKKYVEAYETLPFNRWLIDEIKKTRLHIWFSNVSSKQTLKCLLPSS